MSPTGADSWNKDYLREENISISDTEVNIGGLRADSTYDFYLFVTNLEGEFDEDVFMKIQKKTNSDPGSSGVLTLATSALLAAMMVVFLVLTVLWMGKRTRQFEFSRVAEEEMGEWSVKMENEKVIKMSYN